MPAPPPLERAASASLAAFRASSPQTVTKALTVGCSASMRASAASTTSTGETRLRP